VHLVRELVGGGRQLPAIDVMHEARLRQHRFANVAAVGVVHEPVRGVGNRTSIEVVRLVHHIDRGKLAAAANQFSNEVHVDYTGEDELATVQLGAGADPLANGQAVSHGDGWQ
jgi:hypothetical protein